MTVVIGILADGLVAILLVASIATSLALSRRIARMKADEAAMKETIANLVVASEAAERAIAGLRQTLAQCDLTLAGRLRDAERLGGELGEHVAAGEAVMARVGRILTASRRAVDGLDAMSGKERAAAMTTSADRIRSAGLAAQGVAERASRYADRASAA